MNKYIVISFLMALFVRPAFAAPGVTLIHSGSTTSYASIQAALDAAEAGDTVRLEPGVYHENVVLTHSGQPGNPITLSGASAIIDGANHDLQNAPSGKWTQKADADGIVYYPKKRS